MSESVTTMEIEDILSSIRTLVSSDITKARPENDGTGGAAPDAELPGRLVLTSDLRVGETDQAGAGRARSDGPRDEGDASAHAPGDAARPAGAEDRPEETRPRAAEPLLLDPAKRRDHRPPQNEDDGDASGASQVLHTSGMGEIFDEAPYFDDREADPVPASPRAAASFRIVGGTAPNSQEPQAPWQLHGREDDEAPRPDDMQDDDGGFEEDFLLSDLAEASIFDAADDAGHDAPDAQRGASARESLPHGAMTLEQRIAELEAAVTAQAFDFEPDGSEDGAQHRPTSILRLATEEGQATDPAANYPSKAHDAPAPSFASMRGRATPDTGEAESGRSGGGNAPGRFGQGDLEAPSIAGGRFGAAGTIEQPEQSEQSVRAHGREDRPEAEDGISEGAELLGAGLSGAHAADAEPDTLHAADTSGPGAIPPRNEPRESASDPGEDDERAWIAEAIRAAGLGRAARKGAPDREARASRVHRLDVSGESDMSDDDSTAGSQPMNDAPGAQQDDIEVIAADRARSNSFHSRSARRTEAPEPEPQPAPEESAFLDEDMLREMVAEIVRQELQGALGERITRNVRKLVRREIMRAVSIREFD
ncbi:hypothetical protein [Profundibacterium mesophilum]|uniref:Uncharacterized protein n=1 Tax=Profundibacterium mesophilum KAUST100406-0324 TaxID=1037889 RepID=A0A921NQW5_9RHOB|nr:hypothetical protein [Profundibacterium mesophilum]KAF0676777.1 hypothetical protein PMES_00863 [Profundibacterium mesophilum KAUST100406-0324]